MSRLFYNEDCTQFAYTTPADQIGPDAIHRFIDGLADAGVTDFVSNPNGMRANVALRCREPMWHGYDPGGPDDQPALQSLPAARIPGTRRMLDAMLSLDRQGVDFHAAAFARCRQHGLIRWLSLRMNDIHDNNLPNSPLLSNFWHAHPEWRRGSGYPNDYFRRALDYGQPQVRQHYRALIDEVLERYDMDGLELDFQREPYLFRSGREQVGGTILAAWLADIRAAVQEAGRRRGHPIRLGVRVPSNPETARRLGLDAVQWAADGLVDLIVVTPRWGTTEFAMPLPLWRRLLAPYDVTLAGGLEIRIQPYPDGPAVMQSPETATGNALSVLAGGADAVYLFNFFQNQPAPGDTPTWTTAQFNETLRAMRALNALNTLPRRHIVTYRDIRAPGEAPDQPLPATGTYLHFRLPTGPRPAGRPVQIILGLDWGSPQHPAGSLIELPAVRVNQVLCASPEVSGTTMICPVPDEALMDEAQVIELESNQPMRVVWVECRIAGAE